MDVVDQALLLLNDLYSQKKRRDTRLFDSIEATVSASIFKPAQAGTTEAGTSVPAAAAVAVGAAPAATQAPLDHAPPVPEAALRASRQAVAGGEKKVELKKRPVAADRKETPSVRSGQQAKKPLSNDEALMRALQKLRKRMQSRKSEQQKRQKISASKRPTAKS